MAPPTCPLVGGILWVVFPSGFGIAFDRGRNILCFDLGFPDPDGPQALAAAATECTKVEVVCSQRDETERCLSVYWLLYDRFVNNAPIPDVWMDRNERMFVVLQNPTLYRTYPSTQLSINIDRLSVCNGALVHAITTRRLVRETETQSPFAEMIVVLEAGVPVASGIVDAVTGELVSFRLAASEPVGRGGRVLLDYLHTTRGARGRVVVTPSAIGFFLASGWALCAHERPAGTNTKLIVEEGWLKGAILTPLEFLQSHYLGRDVTEPLSTAVRFCETCPPWGSVGLWGVATKSGTVHHMRAFYLRGPRNEWWSEGWFHVGAARFFMLLMDAIEGAWVDMCYRCS